MYAIIETGGKQYTVKPGDVLEIERLKCEEGDKITFDKVLFMSDEDSKFTGKPLLEGASVTASCLEHGKGDKIIIYKYKAKKDYRKKQGHRQPYTKVKIEDFNKPTKEV